MRTEAEVRRALELISPPSPDEDGALLQLTQRLLTVALEWVLDGNDHFEELVSDLARRNEILKARERAQRQ